MPSDIYFFNATNDLALANNGKSFTPPAILQKFESDLAVLPLFVASENDVVLVPKVPSSHYIEAMLSAGFMLPQFIDQHTFFENAWYERNSINDLRPWGWSKSAHSLFASCLPFTSIRFQSSCYGQWRNELRDLCSRLSAQKVLRSLSKLKIPTLVGEEAVPEQVFSVARVEERLAQGECLVVKLPWSSAGRGLLVVHQDSYKAANRQWIEAGIASQGFIMLEPWLDRRADFSFLFAYENQRVIFKGVTAFETGSKGQFIGNYVHWPVDTQQALCDALPMSVIDAVSAKLASAIEQLPLQGLFSGRFGVDAMIIWQDNQYKVHPCVEINFRATIGHVALEIRNMWDNAKKAFFQIGPIKNYEIALLKHGSAVCCDSQLVSGVFPVTPLLPDTQFVAWIEML